MALENGRSSNTYIRQSTLQTYISQMRWRTLLTNKRGNTSKGNNNYQPICTHYQFTQLHQTYTNVRYCWIKTMQNKDVWKGKAY
jgi:hypothetical protein